jgi:hypothetical protein
MDELNFLRAEVRKCREASLRSADPGSRDAMERLARDYERQAALLQRRLLGA